jgi:hypothetical protein
MINMTLYSIVGEESNGHFQPCISQVMGCPMDLKNTEPMEESIIGSGGG